MAPEAGTRSDDARRKTLEEIRREIDAEYPGLVTQDPADEVGAARRRARRPRAHFGEELAIEELRPLRRRRPRRVFGYLAAGAFGCIVGQALLIGYVAMTRYANQIATPHAAASRLAPTEPSPIDDADEAHTPPDHPALPPPPTAARADATADRREPTPPAASAVPAASVPTPPRTATEGKLLEVLARRVMRALPAVTPPRSALVGPGDWATSQAELRSALTQWLRTAKRGDPDAQAADAEVILGADGQTAKTRFHDRSGSTDVVRELRWTRGPNGWTIVGEAEPAQR